MYICIYIVERKGDRNVKDRDGEIVGFDSVFGE